jgi:hypothetical protein
MKEQIVLLIAKILIAISAILFLICLFTIGNESLTNLDLIYYTGLIAIICVIAGVILLIVYFEGF